MKMQKGIALVAGVLLVGAIWVGWLVISDSNNTKTPTPESAAEAMASTPTPSITPTQTTSTIHPKIPALEVSEFYNLAQTMPVEEAASIFNRPDVIELKDDKIRLVIAVEAEKMHEICDLLPDTGVEIISCSRAQIDAFIPITSLLSIAELPQVIVINVPIPKFQEGSFAPVNPVASEIIPTSTQPVLAHPKLSPPLAQFYFNWLNDPEQAVELALQDKTYKFPLDEENGILKIGVQIKLAEGASYDEFVEQVASIGGKVRIPSTVIPVVKLYQLADLPTVKEIYLNLKPGDFEGSAPALTQPAFAHPKLSPPLAQFYFNWLNDPEQAVELAYQDDTYDFPLIEEDGILKIGVQVKLVDVALYDEFVEQVELLGGKVGIATLIPVEQLYQLADLPTVKEIYLNLKPGDF